VVIEKKFEVMQQEINNAYHALKKGGTIVYPTDTVWGIGCDACDERAVRKVFDIKKRSNSKSLVVLVNSFEMLQHYVGELSPFVTKLVKNTMNPTTFVYNNPINLAKNVIANDNTVAIRIIKNEFCEQLIKKLKKPLVSTSANTSNMVTPNCFDEIDKSILEKVDYVVNLHHNLIGLKSSTILKIKEDGTITIIRK